MNEEYRPQLPPAEALSPETESNSVFRKVIDVVHKVGLPSVLSSHYRETFSQLDWQKDWQKKFGMIAATTSEFTGIVLALTGTPLGIASGIGLYGAGKAVNKEHELGRYIQ